MIVLFLVLPFSHLSADCQNPTCGVRYNNAACITVANCLFKDLNGATIIQGGAICLIHNQANEYSLVSSSSFVGCRVYDNSGTASGGAYYGDSMGQQIASCCFYDCSSDTHGQAIYVHSSQDQNADRYYKQISAFLCGLHGATTAKNGAFSVGSQSQKFEYINFTKCSVTQEGAALHYVTGVNGHLVNITYAIIVECAGESTWFCDRTGWSLQFGYCGFYANTATTLIKLDVQQSLTIDSCRFAGSTTVLTTDYAWGVTFNNCWFDGAAPSGATTSGCRTQSTTASYSYTGVDTYYCAREGKSAQESDPSGGPVDVLATATEAFTDGERPGAVRFVPMGLFVAPLELLW